MNATTHLTAMQCPVCGVHYAMPESMRAYCEAAGAKAKGWHCINGHPLHYPGLSEAEEQRDAARKEADRAKLDAMEQRERALKAERSLAQQTKRVKNGVCPCCHRTFVQLQRHMKTKHPEFPDA